MYAIRVSSSRRISCFLQVFLLFSGLLNCLQWGAFANYLPKQLEPQQKNYELDSNNVNSGRYPDHEEIMEFLRKLGLLANNIESRASMDDTDSESAERMKKVNPYSFQGSRGKRLNANSFMGSRGKRVFANDKRTVSANAFIGSRGKRLVTLLGEKPQLTDLTGVIDKKSDALAFVPTRGRSQSTNDELAYMGPMLLREGRRVNSLSFGPTRGKKYSAVDFIGSRGKKSTLEDYMLNNQNDSPKENYERRASLHNTFMPSRGKRST
uniref:Minor tachykinin n=1 Tax=Callistoctopus minor TaxID=515824 RepID=Q9BLK5_CALMC|nr:minor tachykinin precursor [Callistoctopus minor]